MILQRLLCKDPAKNQDPKRDAEKNDAPINLLGRLSDKGLACTSCGACADACAIGAVALEPDELGFPKPQINNDKCVRCHKCETVCPPMRLASFNSPNPKCWAVIGPEEERLKSSSGGVFPLLAKHVLKEGGHVAGARLADDCRSVVMDVVSSIDDLDPLRGSKYVQSEPNGVYAKVKKLLKSGETVLFTGLPCQVAAMRAIAGNDDQNLYCLDLLCAGAASPDMYRQYLDDGSCGAAVLSVDFRLSRYAWSCFCIEVSYEDGKRKGSFDGSDPWVRASLGGLFLKDSCHDCPFQETPRQGDLTIGDFWSVKILYPDLDTSRGVSVMLVNNEKGKKIYSWLEAVTTTLPGSLEFVQNHNRMCRKRHPHLARRRFFEELLLEEGFSKAVDMAMGWKFDVAISGCWCVLNYGGAITYYALYRVVRSLGFHPVMVESYRIPPAATPNPSVFQETPYPFYNVSRVHKSLDNMKELNERVSSFLLGSDQTLNHSIPDFSMEKSGAAYLFSYVAPWRKRIAYATSFGSTYFLGSPEDKVLTAEQLCRFDYVSVREDAGVNICKEEFDIEASKQIDPVFLCSKEDFDYLAAKSPRKIGDKEVFFYILWPDALRATKRTLSRIKRALCATEVVAIGDARFASERSVETKYPFEKEFHAEDWLQCIGRANFVITDSFHAVCFSIIYRRNFIFVQSDYAGLSSGLDRITSLLTPLGLEDRIVKGLENVATSSLLRTPIDYDAVYAKLDPLVEQGRAWLYHALSTPKEFD